jgi:hypothetical protein
MRRRFVTGTTMGNLCALAAARHAVLERAGWDVEADGLFGAPPVTVVVGEEAHPTLFKALGVLGLGRNRVVTVPADGQGRMRAERLPRLAGPSIVCVQAGNVNTGAFDPFTDCASRFIAMVRGSMSTVPLACGHRPRPTLRHLCAGVNRPTPGPPMHTSG